MAENKKISKDKLNTFLIKRTLTIGFTAPSLGLGLFLIGYNKNRIDSTENVKFEVLT